MNQPQSVPYDVYAKTNNPTGTSTNNPATTLKILNELPLYSLL